MIISLMVIFRFNWFITLWSFWWINCFMKFPFPFNNMIFFPMMKMMMMQMNYFSFAFNLFIYFLLFLLIIWVGYTFRLFWFYRRFIMNLWVCVLLRVLTWFCRCSRLLVCRSCWLLFDRCSWGWIIGHLNL